MILLKTLTTLTTSATLAVLVGCVVDEITTPPPPPTLTQPVPILAGVTYKPFASGHADKFSLGDFDSPYLVRLDDYTNFVADNSSILLNNSLYEVTKTNYQGNTYLGIAGFSFIDYAFLSDNAEVNMIVNLVEANGSIIVSGAVASRLMVTPLTDIYTWMDLQAMKHNRGGGYELRNDITFPDRGSEGLAPEGFEPLRLFTGSFNGNGHTIANLSIDRDSTTNVGIWGYVHNFDSVIKDFVLDHAGISGAEQVGAVVGRLDSGMVSNVGVMSSQNSNVSGNAFVGGLVGANVGTGAIVTGYVTGAVSGMTNVGGLAGYNTGRVAGHATERVSGNAFVGGLVGANVETGAIVTGYVTGAVSGVSAVGGLAGSNDGTVTGCVTGAVSGNAFVGGLVGQSSGTEAIVTGYVTGAVTGTFGVGGLVGANDGTVTGYATEAVTGTIAVGGLVGQNDGTGAVVTGYVTGAVSGTTDVAGLVGGDNNAGTVNGYWDIGSSMQNTSSGGVGISSVANVVYDSTAGTYTDTGNGNAEVFNDIAFTNSFDLPRANATWPTLKAVPPASLLAFITGGGGKFLGFF